MKRNIKLSQLVNILLKLSRASIIESYDTRMRVQTNVVAKQGRIFIERELKPPGLQLL